jgi:6-pyruvoyltetrahydropterin/6-carboxytetrahydropterin synthase
VYRSAVVGIEVALAGSIPYVQRSAHGTHALRCLAMAPEIEITHCEEFSASHRLHNERWSAAKNRRIYGPCNNLHGHNYTVHVSVRGRVDRASGMVMNLSDLMHAMRRLVIDRVDHKSLDNDVPFLRGRVTTAENVAIAFWSQLEPAIRKFKGCRLHRIRLYESRSNYVDCLGPDHPN